MMMMLIIYIYIYIYIYILVYHPSIKVGCDKRFIFSAELNSFEVRIFLLLDRLQYRKTSQISYSQLEGKYLDT